MNTVTQTNTSGLTKAQKPWVNLRVGVKGLNVALLLAVLWCMSNIFPFVLKLHYSQLRAHSARLLSCATQELCNRLCHGSGFSRLSTSTQFENRLIKGVLGQAVAVPLVQISVSSDQGDGTILCGLIDELPQGVDILVGNDHRNLVPVHFGVITRSHTHKTNAGNAVRAPNTKEDIVSDQAATRQMTNVDVTQLETIAQNPSVASLSLNDDASLDLDQDLFDYVR